MKAETRFLLKDQLFNADRVEYLATLLRTAYPAFPHERFCADVLHAFPALELKQRIAHMTTVLRPHLPPAYPDALAVLLAALPPELDPSLSDDDFGDFIFAPVSLFVATYGCSAEHLARSLHALREITKRFSAEDAVRYFLNAFPDQTLAFLHECARDQHYHVRRLASEGSRPLLPWAQRLTIDYRQPLPLLDLLFADRTRYVTRSVANHLNDVSKLDPALVIETLQRWQRSGRQTLDEMSYITKHALRTLVKQGNAQALSLIGVGGAGDVDIISLTTSTPRVRIGDAFQFTLTLRANTDQQLLIDYIITFATGAKKVFRLKRLALAAGETVTLAKSHPMRLMTTRRLQEGEHQVTLKINGQPVATLSFELAAQ